MRRVVLLAFAITIASCTAPQGTNPTPSTNGVLPTQRANSSAASFGSLVRQKVNLGKPRAFTEFQLPDTGEAVTIDVAGTPWVLLPHEVVHLSLSGQITSYFIPLDVSSLIGGITFGSDGALWFEGLTPDPNPLYLDDATVFHLIPHGLQGMRYVVAPGEPNEIDHHPWQPQDITEGIDGKAWFSVANTGIFGGGVFGGITPGSFGRIGPSTVTMYTPRQVTTGPDGNMWVTASSYTKDDANGFVLSVAGDGSIEKTFDLPTPSYAAGIATGPDHNLWVSYSDNVSGTITIVRLTTDGAATSYLVPTPNTFTLGPQYDRIVSGDKEMWFAETGANKIGRITMRGKITEYPIPAANLGPVGLAVSRPCGSNLTYVWFNESGPNVHKLARFTFKENRAKCPNHAASKRMAH